MPPRSPLAERSVNLVERQEYSPFFRGKVIGAVKYGAKMADIARQENVPYSTIKGIVQRSAKQAGGVSNPRTGRPKCYSARDERKLLRYVRLHPLSTYATIAQETGVTLCRQTYRKILQQYGITN